MHTHTLLHLSPGCFACAWGLPVIHILPQLGGTRVAQYLHHVHMVTGETLALATTDVKRVHITIRLVMHRLYVSGEMATCTKGLAAELPRGGVLPLAHKGSSLLVHCANVRVERATLTKGLAAELPRGGVLPLTHKGSSLLVHCANVLAEMAA